MKSHRIGLVGPCAAGKSTLAALLKEAGYNAKPIAQEHSYVINMWERMTNPEVLIYLDVSFHTSLLRRPNYWSEKEYRDEIVRLEHARQHSDALIKTDNLSPKEVFNICLTYLQLVIGEE